jgi:serine/threonine protein kinase
MEYMQQEQSFATQYHLVEQIGKGASSTVWKCVHLPTGLACAAKCIDLRPLKFRPGFDVGRLRREVDIMRGLQHPNIVALLVSIERLFFFKHGFLFQMTQTLQSC